MRSITHIHDLYYRFNFEGEKYMVVNYLYLYISTEYSDYFLYEIRSEGLFLVHTSTPVARSFLVCYLYIGMFYWKPCSLLLCVFELFHQRQPIAKWLQCNQKNWLDGEVLTAVHNRWFTNSSNKITTEIFHWEYQDFHRKVV